jgi:hypothetical protein
MAYLRYFDNRYGDLYEVYTDDVTGQFAGALRSIGGDIAGEKIHYSLLSDLPPHHRNHIEQLIWKHSHPPKSNSHES